MLLCAMLAGLGHAVVYHLLPIRRPWGGSGDVDRSVLPEGRRTMTSEKNERCACGFVEGQRVRMRSGLLDKDGLPIGYVHGVVDTWQAGCGHIAMWTLGTATALPNPNVEPEVDA